MSIQRIPSPEVAIGTVKIGAKNSVAIQSMTNTDTADTKATVRQIIQLAEAGSDIVRITVNDEASAEAVPEIRKLLDRTGYKKLPIVGDFHFNGHKLLTKFPETATNLDKYRINPGNVGYGNKHDHNFEAIIKIALQHNKPVRIGVNWGSIDRELLTEMMNKNNEQSSPLTSREVVIETMVESAIRSAQLAKKIGLPHHKIVLSVKMSGVQDVIEAYQLLTERTKKQPYCLHLGLTEAGSGLAGVVSSTSALAILLQQGIGDTIRISLTPTPDEPRTKEVGNCKLLLQALGLRYFTPKVTSCPGCGRTDSTFFQQLAAEVNQYLEEKMTEWRAVYPDVAKMKVAVMGCIVNGPGESAHADIAISLPGRNEEKMAPIYIDGKLSHTIFGSNIPQQFIAILEEYVKNKYSK